MPLNIGDTAPPISGTDVAHNEPWSLQGFQNTTVLLAFSGITWCGPCQMEAPHLEAAWQHLQGGTNVPFTMAIISGMFGSEESPPGLQNAIAQFGITFPVIPGGTSAWPSYKIDAVPTLYCLHWEGGKHVVHAVEVGALASDEQVLQFLAGCGVSKKTLNLPDARKWAAVLIMLLGGADVDGGGTGITPGGKPIPIDPMRYLGAAGRDAIVGLAAAEAAGLVQNPSLRGQLRHAGLELAKTSVTRLAHTRPVGGAQFAGAAWGADHMKRTTPR